MTEPNGPVNLTDLLGQAGMDRAAGLHAAVERQRRLAEQLADEHDAQLDSLAERNAEVEEQRLATVAREEAQLQVNRETATTLAEMKAAAEAAGVEDARRHRREMVLLVASVLIALLSLIVAVVALIRP